MTTELKPCCPYCNSPMIRAGHPEMCLPKPGKENTKQNYRCTNKLCRRRTVNPVMMETTVENKTGG